MSSSVLMCANEEIVCAGLEESLSRIVSSSIPGESNLCEGVCMSKDAGAPVDGTAEINKHDGEPIDILLDADSIAKSQPGPNTELPGSLDANVSNAVDHTTPDILSAAEEGLDHLTKN